MSQQFLAINLKQLKTLATPPDRHSLLQRTCSCGQHTLAGGQCAECRQNGEERLQHATITSTDSTRILSSVSETSSSPRQAVKIASPTRESRFGYDFSQVQVHRAAPQTIQAQLTINETGDQYEQEADRVAGQVMQMPTSVTDGQKTCACGRPAGPDGLCEHCRQKRSSLQRNTTSAVENSTAPPIVHNVLHTPGHPLDVGTRTFMESHFGQDFSNVRVHTDEKAAASARAVNALAYTVGRDIVFERGQYKPLIAEGRRLLAHELTHVVQQTMTQPGQKSSSSSPVEQEAQSTIHNRSANRSTLVNTSLSAMTIQRQSPSPPATTTTTQPAPSQSATTPTATTAQPSRADAQKIVDHAKSQQAKPQKGATDAVRDILKEYYPQKVSLVQEVVFDDAKAKGGLSTEKQLDHKTKTYYGKIYVGTAFFDSIVHPGHGDFAHRVLQVGHELEHIEQYRSGMTEKGTQCEREFLAFYHEGLAEPLPGTGGMWRPTRVEIIDAAIGYYYCLTPDDQKKYENNKHKLENRRKLEMVEIADPKKHFPTQPPATPPSTCTMPPGAEDCRPVPPKSKP